jgi:hypothetical protein
MELLSRLLGSAERVKMMRFFLHHKDAVVSLSELSEKTKSKSLLVKKELTLLLSIGFIEKKRTRTVVTVGTAKKAVSKVKEVSGYTLDTTFPHVAALEELLFDFQSIDKKDLIARFKALGRIKLFLLTGVFLGDEKARVDMFIVGEGIKKPKVEKLFEALSAELGRDIVYSLMDVEEYDYRYKMYDKFVRDIVEGRREVLIDKLREIK